MKLLGSTTPRIWTPPLAVGPPGPCGCGCALTPATSLGFNCVDYAYDPIQMRPFPWQRWLLIHALELVNGRFRYRTVLILVARQNGKTSIIEVKNLWKLYVLQVSLIIGTAQVLDIAEESWDKAIEIVEGTPELKAELETISKVNGKKQFKLSSGARWKIAAASRRARGFAGADDVNLDELREHTDWLTWGAITKTTMAKEQAQIFAFSNAGDDTSVPLNTLQKSGRLAAREPALADSSIGFFEWSAPDDTRCTCGRLQEQPHRDDCQMLDPRLLRMANPSMNYPGGVSESALRSSANTDPDPIYLTECLCVRVPTITEKIIDPQKWKEIGDSSSRRAGDVAIAVDIAQDRKWAAIGLYGKRSDEIGHLQLVDYRQGTGWIVGRLQELKEILNPLAIGMAKWTYASLEGDLRKVGIVVPEEHIRMGPSDDPFPPHRGDLCVLAASDMATACGQLIDAVREGTLRHVPSQQLTTAVESAKTRQSGGAVAWSPTGGDVDITPVPAVTEARWVYYKRVGTTIDEQYDPVADIW